MRELARGIRRGIARDAVVKHRDFGEIFAYEVDGYGSTLLMDDANYPSLLALPLMGFLSSDDKTYQNTRKMLLEKGGNPYYLVGAEFKGIGGMYLCGFHSEDYMLGWVKSTMLIMRDSRTSHWTAECMANELAGAGANVE